MTETNTAEAPHGQANVVLSCGCKQQWSGSLPVVGAETRCKQTSYSARHAHPKVKSFEITAVWSDADGDYVALPGHEVQ